MAQLNDEEVVHKFLETLHRLGIKKYKYVSIVDIVLMLSELREKHDKQTTKS